MMVSFCSWDWKRRGVPVPARFCNFSQWGHGVKASSRPAPQPWLSNSPLQLFLHWKRRDIHQCHSGSLVPAVELLAVNNEIVEISFLSPSKQAGHRFYPLVEHMNQSFCAWSVGLRMFSETVWLYTWQACLLGRGSANEKENIQLLPRPQTEMQGSERR